MTMPAGDEIRKASALPGARMVAVHVEAINHCLLARDGLRAELDREGLVERGEIPAGGETLSVP